MGPQLSAEARNVAARATDAAEFLAKAKALREKEGNSFARKSKYDYGYSSRPSTPQLSAEARNVAARAADAAEFLQKAKAMRKAEGKPLTQESCEKYYKPWL